MSLAIRRRAVLAMPVVLAACSDNALEQDDALDQITRHIRDGQPQGESRLENLVLKSMNKTANGYDVFVDYDLVSTMPSVGLFNTLNHTGERQHVAGERFAFVRGANGWVIQ